MNVVFTPTAWQQYTDWQREDKKDCKADQRTYKEYRSRWTVRGNR